MRWLRAEYDEGTTVSDYGSVELSGPARSQVISECFDHIRAWGLTMPQVEPIVLNFGLDDFRATGMIEFWVANERELGYCTKFLFLFQGQRCPCHYHKMKHETFLVVRGKTEMTVADKPQEMTDGDLLVMPPGIRHTFVGLEPTLLLEASMPSILRDNLFDDSRIGSDGVI